MKTLIIGIAGGSCSGKTTLAEKLCGECGLDASLIRHDDYYLSRKGVPTEQRKLINYDHPSALETSLLIEQLKALREGKTVECPVYDFTVHDRKEETRRVSPSRTVIVDGVLIFENAELRKLFDYRIFVDTDSDLRLARRVLRDVRSRGRRVEDIVEQYLTTVKPMHERYVEPYKKYADTVLDGSDTTSAAETAYKIVEKLLNGDE